MATSAVGEPDLSGAQDMLPGTDGGLSELIAEGGEEPKDPEGTPPVEPPEPAEDPPPEEPEETPGEDPEEAGEDGGDEPGLDDDESGLTFKKLKTHDKESFKKFPELATTLQEHRQYKQVFVGGVEEAKASIAMSERFQDVLLDLGNGDIGGILQAVHRSDPQAFARIAKDVMPQVAQLDQQAYQDFASKNVKNVLRNLADLAEEESNQELSESVRNITYKLFGSLDLSDPDEDPRVVAAVQAAREQEQRGRVEHVEAAWNGLLGGIKTSFEAILEKGIKRYGIPKNDIYSRALRQDVVDELNGDKSFNKHVSLLKARAMKLGRFTPQMAAKLNSVYLARAKKAIATVAPKIANKTGPTATPKGVDVPEKRTKAKPRGKLPALDRIDRENTTLRDMIEDNPTLL